MYRCALIEYRRRDRSNYPEQFISGLTPGIRWNIKRKISHVMKDASERNLRFFELFDIDLKENCQIFIFFNQLKPLRSR